MNISFQQADEADKAFLWQLSRVAYEPVVTAQFGAWDEHDQLSRFETKWSQAPFSLVLLDGVPVGAFSATLETDAVFVREVLVLPEHQNRGIGTLAMTHLQSWANNLALPLRLQVLHLNTAAQRLYERLGFSPYGTSETHVLMRRDHTGGGNFRSRERR